MIFTLFKKKISEEPSLPKRMWHDKELSEKEKVLYKNIFTQITGEEFIDILEDRFTPFIKSLGFKGSKKI